jgi:tetratricopeptide (TPR) repeat protein
MDMHNLANSYDALGRQSEALNLREETLALRKAKLPPDHPDTLQSMGNLAISYNNVGRYADALKLYEVTLAIQESKLGPDHSETLRTKGNMARNLRALGRYVDALKVFEEVLSLQEAKGDADHSDTLGVMSSLAWLLATAADAKFRNPSRAVELAAQAARGAPHRPEYRGTLGIARYRAGDWNGAVADLEKSIRLHRPDDWKRAYPSLFLAMAHWQLGEKDKARDWFDKAVHWMERGEKDDAELKRFRAEAAKMLGIEIK